MFQYEIVVGNIGTVVTTNLRQEAIKSYNDYVSFSKLDYGRAAGEDVTLFEDGEPIMEHTGHLNTENV